MRKSIIVLSLCTILLFCDEYPPNPENVKIELKGISIRHTETDYIPVNPPMKDMMATKVNVLVFRFVVRGIEVDALEFYGKAIVAGPPEGRIYAVHFRTDSLGLIPEGTHYHFNIIDKIEPDSTYVIVRPQYPTNEYSPFTDSRGKIMSIEIDEVWAYWEDGTVAPVSMID